MKTRETKKVRLGIAPEHFVISHDGRWAYVCDREEGAVSIVDLVNNQEVNRIPGFSILPDMSKVYVSNLGVHEIGVIDVKSQKLIKTIYVGGSHVLASLNLDKKLSEINGIVNPLLRGVGVCFLIPFSTFPTTSRANHCFKGIYFSFTPFSNSSI